VWNTTDDIALATALMGGAEKDPSTGAIILRGSDGSPSYGVQGKYVGDSMTFTLESKQGNEATGENPSMALSYIATVCVDSRMPVYHPQMVG